MPNYMLFLEGYVHLASPFMQSSPIMINRAMRINSEPETESENIELMSGSRMQLPTPEILGTFYFTKIYFLFRFGIAI
jgi:hypothetical protein